MTLKELRKKSNKTLKAVATECGCSVNAIWLYENGKRKLPLNKISALAVALNVSTGEIVSCILGDKGVTK